MRKDIVKAVTTKKENVSLYHGFVETVQQQTHLILRVDSSCEKYLHVFYT